MGHLRALLLLGILAAGAPTAGDAQAKKEVPALDWNQFRGPRRNAHSPDTGLLKTWPSSGPPLAWKAAGVGAGFSSVCAWGKFVFTMGEEGNKTYVVALAAADGKLLWKLPIASGFTEQQGGQGPRSTPATDGTVVIALAPTGELVCIRIADGRQVWQKRMQEFGASQPGFGFVESPYIDGGMVLVSPGGTVVALSKLNGQTVWKSRKLKGSTDYSSLSVGEIGKLKQYLVMTDKSVAGVMATTGDLLWEGDFPGDRAVVPTPVAAGNTVFVAAGYGVGCKAFNIALTKEGVKFQEAYASTQFQIHHGGMVLVGEHVYGCSDQGTLRCVELATGKPAWTDRGVGKGSIAFADGMLYCRGEGGGVALVEANPAAYKEGGRFTPPLATGNKVWSHPAVSGGKLYLREQDTLFAYNVRQ